MALSPCNSFTDQYGRELVTHGSAAFPIACYHNDLIHDPVPWHWHEELEAAIITEGAAVLSIGSEKYTVQAGEGFFINTGVLHGACAVDGCHCRIHSLVFHSKLVGGSEGSVFYQNYLRPLTENPTLEWIPLSPSKGWQCQALEALERAWKTCVDEDSGYEFLVRSALSELVWILRSQAPAHSRVPNTKRLRDAERIKLMLSCIHENFGSELNTQMIAASAAVSESECLRCFRSTIGTTPIQYLKQYRIRQAALQLSSTNDKIAEIAVRCGFQDMSYFTKSFRESYSCTPSEYRKA